MENNEMMNNEVVEEATEEIAKTNSNSMMAAGIGLAVVALGFVAYKYAVKPMVAKIKEKKKAKSVEVPDAQFEVVDSADEN